MFERVVEACITAGLVGGEGFAVDASLIMADANKQRSIPGKDWDKERDAAATLSWLVNEKKIAPHFLVIDKIEAGPNGASGILGLDEASNTRRGTPRPSDRRLLQQNLHK